MTTQHQAPEVTSELLPVTQADRDFAALWIVIAPQNAKIIRAGEWDHHPGVQAAARHRATQPLSLSVDEGRLRDCLADLLCAHDQSCGHFDITHTAEKIAPLLLDRLQSLSLPVGDADLAQTVAAWRDHFAPDGKRIRLDPANKESLHAVLGRVVAALGEQIANCSGDIDRSGLAQEVE